MSLLSRVTSIDGHDRLPPEVDAKQLGYGTAKSLRRVISYDAIPRPFEDSQATAPSGGVTAYKVSVLRRLSKYNSIHSDRTMLIRHSAGDCSDSLVLVGSGNRVWFCGAEACTC